MTKYSPTMKLAEVLDLISEAVNAPDQGEVANEFLNTIPVDLLPGLQRAIEANIEGSCPNLVIGYAAAIMYQQAFAYELIRQASKQFREELKADIGMDFPIHFKKTEPQ